MQVGLIQAKLLTVTYCAGQLAVYLMCYSYSTTLCLINNCIDH